MVLVAPEYTTEAWWKSLDMLTVARTYIPAHLDVYLGDGQQNILPGPPWRTSISLVDSIKWKTQPFRTCVVRLVRQQNKGKTLQSLKQEMPHPKGKHILVTTRSGRQTLSPSDADDSEVEPDSPTSPLEDTNVQPQQPAPTQAPPQLFKYWAQMSPEEQRERRAARMGKKRHRTTTTTPTEVQPPHSPQSTPVMAESWADSYVNSSTFSEWWQQTQNSQTPWPQGIQLHQGRMYSQGKLCVPEPLVQRVLWEFHNTSGHMGIHRMTNEVKHRFLMPPEQDIPTLIEGIRHDCGTC